MDDESTARPDASRGAAMIVFSEDSTQLLLHRREDFRVWALPGGGVEPGETPEAAAVREVFEETGYHVAVDRQVAEYWRPQVRRDGSVNLFFAGRVIRGEALTRGPETLEVAWFPVDDLPRSLHRFAREAIKDSLSPGAGPVKRTQTMFVLEALLVRALFRLRDLRNRLLRRK